MFVESFKTYAAWPPYDQLKNSNCLTDIIGDWDPSFMGYVPLKEIPGSAPTRLVTHEAIGAFLVMFTNWDTPAS